MEVLIAAWFISAVVVGWLAVARGRSGGWYFVGALLLSPLIGYCMLMAVSDLAAVDREEAHRERMVRDLLDGMKRAAER